MRLETMKTGRGYVVVSNDFSELPTLFPKLVMERLNTGEWEPWQIDNPNDWDAKTQRDILATDTSFKLEGIGQFEIEKKETWRSELNRVFPKLYTSGLDASFIQHTEDGFMEGYNAAKKDGCHTENDVRMFINSLYWFLRANNVKDGQLSPEGINEFVDDMFKSRQLIAIEVDEVLVSEEYPNGMLQVKEYIYG